MKKKFLLLMLAAVLVIAGCGKKKETVEEAEGRFYKTEYVEVDVPENSYMGTTCFAGNAFYYAETTYDPNDMTGDSAKTVVKKMDLETREVTTTPIEVSGNSYLADMCIDNDGNLCVYRQYTKWNEDYSEVLESENELMVFDGEFNQINSIDMNPIAQEKGDNFYINGMEFDENGNLVMTDCNSFVLAIDANGEKVLDLPMENYSNGLTKAADGKLYMANHDANWDPILQPIDVVGKQFGEPIEHVPESSNGNDAGMIDKNGNYIVTNGTYLYSFNIETGEQEMLLNWIDYDINGNYISFSTVLDDGTIVVMNQDYSADEQTAELAFLTETDKPENDKTILTYACMDLDYNLTSAIIRFNKTNDEYRIRVVDYTADTDDYEATQTNLDNAIMSEDGPDIISVNQTNYNNYATKGILADLYPLMDADSSVSKDDYIANVLGAFEIDGSLYAMPIDFSVSSVLGKSSQVGSEPGWEIADVVALMDTLPEDVQVFEYGTKSSILSWCYQYGMNKYVNWETGECNFDSPEFIEALEFANRFPDEASYEEEGDSFPARIQNGKLLLITENFSEITSLQMYHLMFGDDVTFIGFPGAEGNGSAVNFGSMTLGISEKSANQDGAWQFIKYLTTEEYQTKNIDWYMPINKKALDAMLTEAATPEMYDTDGDGVEEEQPKTTWGYDDFEATIYAATEDEINMYKNMILGAQALFNNDENINNIIMEESAAYFSGQKSVEDVAGIIQSRVEIYVNENR